MALVVMAGRDPGEEAEVQAHPLVPGTSSASRGTQSLP